MHSFITLNLTVQVHFFYLIVPHMYIAIRLYSYAKCVVLYTLEIGTSKCFAFTHCNKTYAPPSQRSLSSACWIWIKIHLQSIRTRAKGGWNVSLSLLDLLANLFHLSVSTAIHLKHEDNDEAVSHLAAVASCQEPTSSFACNADAPAYLEAGHFSF